MISNKIEELKQRIEEIEKALEILSEISLTSLQQHLSSDMDNSFIKDEYKLLIDLEKEESIYETIMVTPLISTVNSGSRLQLCGNITYDSINLDDIDDVAQIMRDLIQYLTINLNTKRQELYKVIKIENSKKSALTRYLLGDMRGFPRWFKFMYEPTIGNGQLTIASNQPLVRREYITIEELDVCHLKLMKELRDDVAKILSDIDTHIKFAESLIKEE